MVAAVSKYLQLCLLNGLKRNRTSKCGGTLSSVVVGMNQEGGNLGVCRSVGCRATKRSITFYVNDGTWLAESSDMTAVWSYVAKVKQGVSQPQWLNAGCTFLFCHIRGIPHWKNTLIKNTLWAQLKMEFLSSVCVFRPVNEQNVFAGSSPLSAVQLVCLQADEWRV